MKKCILLIALFLGLQANQVNFAQDSQSFCAFDAVDGLNNCLMGNGVQFSIVYSGNNSIYIVGKGNQPPGKTQSCIAAYNHDASSCEDAPVIIDNPNIKL